MSFTPLMDLVIPVLSLVGRRLSRLPTTQGGQKSSRRKRCKVLAACPEAVQKARHFAAAAHAPELSRL
jgi:hypothetical protein